MVDTNEPPTGRSRARALVLAAVVAVVVTLGLVALLANIFERKQEGRNPFYRVVELTDDTEDPAILWHASTATTRERCSCGSRVRHSWRGCGR